jgi:hypothetical protein
MSLGVARRLSLFEEILNFEKNLPDGDKISDIHLAC